MRDFICTHSFFCKHLKRYKCKCIYLYLQEEPARGGWWKAVGAVGVVVVVVVVAVVVVVVAVVAVVGRQVGR